LPHVFAAIGTPFSTTEHCTTFYGKHHPLGAVQTASSTTYVQLDPVLVTITSNPVTTVTAPESTSTTTETGTDTETTTLSTVTGRFFSTPVP
jgi:hypothetical protein